MWPFNIWKKKTEKEYLEDIKYVDELESKLIHTKTVSYCEGYVYNTTESEYILTLAKSCNPGKRFGWVRTLWKTELGNYFLYDYSFLGSIELIPISKETAIQEVLRWTEDFNSKEEMEEYVFNILGVTLLRA